MQRLFEGWIMPEYRMAALRDLRAKGWCGLLRVGLVGRCGLVGRERKVK